MKVFSSNPDEFALISVGQMAWGVIAFGQLARGFIAVGQLAIGVVAFGQAAVSVFGAGMVGIGVLWFAGLGAGGRGFCLRLVPKVEPKAIDPEEIPLDRIWHQNASGMVRLDVVPNAAGGMPALGRDGQFLPIKLTPEMAASLQAFWNKLGGSVYAKLRRHGSFFVCDRLVTPGSAPRTGPSMAFNATRLVGLLLLAIVWWGVFGKAVLAG